jgi:uncharacterized membrane protein YfcA
MPAMDTALIVLAGIALFAAFVNGAIGYGFSSLTVPVALIFYTNRILNPAVVVIEILINLYVLFINRAGVPAVLKRVFPILIGLLPGIGVGSSVFSSSSSRRESSRKMPPAWKWINSLRRARLEYGSWRPDTP